MTRLPWHGRSRTKSGGDKSHLSNPQDWFSRNTSEPSRQALSELVKAHKREKSDDSNGKGSRSRGNTIASLDWQKDESRTGSISDEACTSPTSPQRGREGSVYSTMDRSEGTTKALLAKGSLILRRTGSKMSLSSAASSSNLGFTSPPRGHSSTASSGNTSSRDEIRNRISVPFDFKHINHVERRADESDLAHSFGTIKAEQYTRSEPKSTVALDGGQPRVTSDLLQQLPTTPPRPAPPPKDEISITRPDSNLLQSKSPPASPTSPQIPKYELLPFINTSFLMSDVPSPLPSARSLSKSELDEVDLADKPLPQLPVIHAVTTEDDTARAMISAPLPTPPTAFSSTSDGEAQPRNLPHQRQKSSIALPRHLSLYPSTKTSMPNLVTASQIAGSGPSKPIPRHHSDMALSRQARDVQASSLSRTSTSFAAIDTMDWEEAVDEAWDEADDYDGDMSTYDLSSFESYVRTNSANVDPAHSDHGRSAVSTPLMMAGPPRMAVSASERASPVLGMEPHKLESVQEDEQAAEVSGLGISSCPPSASLASAGNFSRSSSLHLPRRRSSLSYSTSDRLTRSSSQESIILSIASSIIGTTRSSNSSVLADDLNFARKAQDGSLNESFGSGHEDGMSLDDAYQKTRPESGCLPADIFEQMTRAGLTFDTEDEAPKVEVFPSHPPPPPPAHSHKHSKSTSKVMVPERSSSIYASDHTKTSRCRSHTAGTRPHVNTRISYSLFPNKAISPYSPPITS